MRSTLTDLIQQARDIMLAPETATATIKADRYWTNAELLAHAVACCKSVWRKVIDLHEEHFMEIDDSGGVTMPANGTKLAGVPSDTFRVILIEPLDITSSGESRGLKFKPRKFKSPEFTAARGAEALDPSSDGTIYYALSHQGAPVRAPIIYVAPTLTSTLQLRFARVPVLQDLSAKSPNPIPGESDLCIVAWIVAYAKAKEREDQSPDPNWLAIHTNERDSLLVTSSERQEQAAIVLKGVFDDEDAEW